MENQELIKQVTEKAEKWLTPAYDAETQAEVKRMLENDDKTELIEAFYKDLEFGTGGLRGIMGVGSNRMNIYTVGAATQGLSNYLKKNLNTTVTRHIGTMVHRYWLHTIKVSSTK